MKQTIMILSMWCVAVCMQAQTARQVLDRAASEFKKTQSITAEFELSTGGGRDKGTIILQGQKFRTTTSGNTIWFDGKTMWTYVHDNEEVNVTEPTAAQVARINPYSFLNMYKQGYDVAFGGSTLTDYEVVLTATNNKASIQKAILRIKKTDYTPLYVMMGTARADVEISVTSYKKTTKQPDATFRFNKQKYPKVEVVDLR
ncbi:MAG: cell envelope biogenesis protein LolA [Bacteroidaceae bacterium]|nr:cell envelope biogenesis protein LolA [Bacteroidaceae bacterium]MBQ9176911.1 cell envelope biogenesis protein LolA [Bacteroidaceae bacterium]MBR1378415.1 cell envelope biogenesis protein LolA [Bacteroidaceae bacterium]